MTTADKATRKAAKQAVRRYSNALSNLARAWLALHVAENHGAALPDSAGAHDTAYLAEKCGELYDDPGGSISALVSGRMGVAVDHLHGTSKLYVTRETGVFSVWATARSFFEMVAIAYWLTEPDVSPEERLGRVINDRLVSLYGSQRFIDKGLVGDENIEVKPRERIADVLARSEKLGYELARKAQYGTQLEPEHPSYSELVDGLFAGGLYSLLSAMSHGEIWTISHHQRDVTHVTDVEGQQRKLAQLSVSVDEYQGLAGYMQVALGVTVKRPAEWSV